MEKGAKSRVFSVLALDDRLSYLSDIQTLLRIQNFDADVASSVDQAAELMRSKPYDLLICDMMMPSGAMFSELETQGGVRTGLFFCQYTRLHFPDTAIVLLTSAEVTGFDRDFLFELQIEILRKSEVNQVEVVRYAEKIANDKPSVSIADLFDIKPGAFGLSFDVKKAMKFLQQFRGNGQAPSLSEVRKKWIEDRSENDEK